MLPLSLSLDPLDFFPVLELLLPLDDLEHPPLPDLLFFPDLLDVEAFELLDPLPDPLPELLELSSHSSVGGVGVGAGVGRGVGLGVGRGVGAGVGAGVSCASDGGRVELVGAGVGAGDCPGIKRQTSVSKLAHFQQNLGTTQSTYRLEGSIQIKRGTASDILNAGNRLGHKFAIQIIVEIAVVHADSDFATIQDNHGAGTGKVVAQKVCVRDSDTGTFGSEDRVSQTTTVVHIVLEFRPRDVNVIVPSTSSDDTTGGVFQREALRVSNETGAQESYFLTQRRNGRRGRRSHGGAVPDGSNG